MIHSMSKTKRSFYGSWQRAFT